MNVLWAVIWVQLLLGVFSNEECRDYRRSECLKTEGCTWFKDWGTCAASSTPTPTSEPGLSSDTPASVPATSGCSQYNSGRACSQAGCTWYKKPYNVCVDPPTAAPTEPKMFIGCSETDWVVNDKAMCKSYARCSWDKWSESCVDTSQPTVAPTRAPSRYPTDFTGCGVHHSRRDCDMYPMCQWMRSDRGFECTTTHSPTMAPTSIPTRAPSSMTDCEKLGKLDCQTQYSDVCMWRSGKCWDTPSPTKAPTWTPTMAPTDFHDCGIMRRAVDCRQYPSCMWNKWRNECTDTDSPTKSPTYYPTMSPTFMEDCTILARRDCVEYSQCEWKSGGCHTTSAPTAVPSRSPTSAPSAFHDCRVHARDTCDDYQMCLWNKRGGADGSGECQDTPSPTMVPTRAPTMSPTDGDGKELKGCEDESRQKPNKKYKGKSIKSKTASLCDCEDFCVGEGGHAIAYKAGPKKKPEKGVCFCYVKKPKKGLKEKKANKYTLVFGIDE